MSTKSTILELQQRYTPFWKWQANSISIRSITTHIGVIKCPILEKNEFLGFDPFSKIENFYSRQSQKHKTLSMVLNSQHMDTFCVKNFLNSEGGVFGYSIFGDFFLEKMKKIQNFEFGGSNFFWPPKNMGDGCSMYQVSWIPLKPSWLWGMGKNTPILPFLAMPDFQKKI